MVLLKYFKPIKSPTTSTLPLLSRPLSKVMPSSSIEAANEEVKSILKSSENDVTSTTALTVAMKRGPYVKFSQQAKVSVVKYASEHGVAAALHHYIKKFPELKESTVRTWRSIYVTKLQRKRKIQDNACIKELPEKREDTLFCWVMK